MLDLLGHTKNVVYQPWNFSSNLMWFLLTVVLILTIYHFWLQSLEYVKLGNKLPGVRSLPILGHIHLAIGINPKEMMSEFLKAYYKYFSNVSVGKLWVGPKLYVGLSDPHDIELILGSTVHLEKSREYSLFEPWLGDGLLISKGEKWSSHRKMIAPTFHSTILKSFMPIFNKNANHLLDVLKAEEGKSFDVHDYMSKTTVDILLETAMGVKKTDNDDTGFEYAKAVMSMCNILHLRHYKIWLRPNFLFKFTNMAKEQKKLLGIIHSLTNRVIDIKNKNFLSREAEGETSLYKEVLNVTNKQSTNQKTENYHYIRDDLEEIEEADVGEKKRLAFLDFMIEASHNMENNLSNTDIREEVNTIMFEGHDTTAAGSSFVLCLLGVHQNVQERVLEELREIFQDDWNRPVTFNDTLQMKYLERVIMETLRLYPPVPFIARQINENIRLASKSYIIPSGTTVIISQYMVHRNEKYWPNPFKFDPDNFLPERCQNRHFYSYIPFSAGPRSCVGRKYAMLKLKVILATVLRKYKFTSPKNENDFKLMGDIILKRADGFEVQIESRKI